MPALLNSYRHSFAKHSLSLSLSLSLFTLYNMKCNHQKSHITRTANKHTTRSSGLRTLGETNTTLNV